jgi:hypothetical protein
MVGMEYSFGAKSEVIPLLRGTWRLFDIFLVRERKRG